MSNLERKVNAMIRLQLAQDESEKEAALAELKQLNASTDTEPVMNDRDVLAEEMIHDLLAKVGVPTANLGHKYLVYGIAEAVKNPNLTDNMTYRFYPEIARRFDRTSARVERAIRHGDEFAFRFDSTSARAERAIRHSIELAFTYGDATELDEIFGATISAEKGKVVVGEFVSRLANIVRIQLRKVA